MDVDVALDLRPGEQIGRHAPGQLVAAGISGGGRAWSEIHHLGARLAGAVHQREANAAETGVPWLVRGECQRGRHRRIDRVAAGVQHGDPGLGRPLAWETTMPRRPFAEGLLSRQCCVTCGGGVYCMTWRPRALVEWSDATR